MMRTTYIAILVGFIYVVAARSQPAPASFAYVLQAERLGEKKADAVERLATCGRDWVILDSMFESDTPWSRGDLDVIRGGREGRKVIAYISIGEAEDYRPYWRKGWVSGGKLTAAAPSWLGGENSAWKGNFRVNYWDVDWQKVILAAVDDAMGRGFDGVYLDIVDGFENFEQDGEEFIDDRLNPETKQSYRRDMIDWVKAVAARARAKNPAAIVVPQNGAQLLARADFVATISAIGIEDLFTDGDRLQPKSHGSYLLGYLKRIADAGKPALLIEYPTSAKRKDVSRKLAKEDGMILLLTDRQLKTLGVSGNGRVSPSFEER